MKALRFNDAWNLTIENIPSPEIISDNQVVVRIAASTICGTDIGIVSGLYDAKKPLTLGHEASGEIAEIGKSVSRFKKGDRVAIDPTYFCMQCWMCLNDRQNHCQEKIGTETGVTRDGTFTEYYLTEERFLHKIPDHVSHEEACLTEPLSCVLTGVNQLRLRYNLATSVVGGGPIGMLYSHALALNGIQGAIVEVSPERREICKDIAPEGWEICESLDEARSMIETHTKDKRLDLVVDASGAAVDESVPILNRGGQILVVGLRPKPFQLDPMEIADRSLSIIGSIDTIGTFSESLNLITSGKIPAKKFLTHERSLSDFEDAFKLVSCDIPNQSRNNNASAMKVVIKP